MKHVNQTLKVMIQAFVACHYNNWNEYLMLLEFAYNYRIQASSGHSIFFFNTSQHLIILAIIHHPININNPNFLKIYHCS
uniref:Predicted protein n=1 Tax=Physcomitrium patens TaxID=3218 RepID=A9TZN5_PHYPA